MANEANEVASKTVDRTRGERIDDARRYYQSQHGKMHRKAVADANRGLRNARSADAQLKLLDARLGKGQGAQRERARLVASGKGPNKAVPAVEIPRAEVAQSAGFSQPKEKRHGKGAKSI